MDEAEAKELIQREVDDLRPRPESPKACDHSAGAEMAPCTTAGLVGGV